MTLLIVALFYINSQKELQNLDKKLISKMNLCSFTLDCKEYKIDFVPKSKQPTFELYKNKKEIYSLYPVKEADDFFLKIYLDYNNYIKQMKAIYKELAFYFLITMIVVIILSILFSFYALNPLRQSLLLTREFIRDILHDFNTPMSTMCLNLSLLQQELGENRKIKRIERSVENILSLQDNLKHYLLNNIMTIEDIDLKKLIIDRVEMIEKNYLNLNYSIDISDSIFIKSNEKALIRIFDNLISNASKYNKEGGEVNISYIKESKSLKIADTGRGIANPNRVFERFYKEYIRGVGIGLHIVKKLCDELGIKISIQSKLNIGTTILLKF
jgi:signal transduction histidine kinase